LSSLGSNESFSILLSIRGVGRTMVVRFFASIRGITGVKEVTSDQPSATLGELLCLLSDCYGPDFRRWVLEGQNLGGSVMVVINGDDARHQAGLETRLALTDVVSIFPIMAGGRTTRAVSYQRSDFSENKPGRRTLLRLRLRLTAEC